MAVLKGREWVQPGQMWLDWAVDEEIWKQYGERVL
jgi:hypothetical protein